MQGLREECTELECIDDEPELILGVFLADSENLEHPLLHVGLMDTDRASSKLSSVQDEIVCIRTNLLKIFLLVAIIKGHVLRLRSCERWCIA